MLKHIEFGITRYIITILFMTAGIYAEAQSPNKELSYLIYAANIEMNGDFDNRMNDGSYKETNKFHLEQYEESVAYVSVFIKSYIDIINGMEDFKDQQLEVFRYVEPNPAFQMLLDYLISHNLPLYQYCVSKDGKHKTTILKYTVSDLKEFGKYTSK